MANHDRRTGRKVSSSSHPSSRPMMEELEQRLMLSASIISAILGDAEGGLVPAIESNSNASAAVVAALSTGTQQQSYSVSFSVSDAPIWLGSAGFDETLTFWDWEAGPWTFRGYGIESIGTTLDARVWASTGTVDIDFSGDLVVTYPEYVLPGQQNVPITMAFQPKSGGSISGDLGAGFDITLDFDLDFKIPFLDSAIGFTTNLEDIYNDYLATLLGTPTIPNNIILNTQNKIFTPSFGSAVSTSGASPILNNLAFDLLTLATFIPPVAPIAGPASVLLDLNLGLDLGLRRTDHFKPKSLEGDLYLDGANSTTFSFGSGSQMVYVDIPSSAHTGVELDIRNLDLNNDFYASFGLDFDPYFGAYIDLPFFDPYELYRKDFLSLSPHLYTLPGIDLDFSITDPSPLTIPVRPGGPTGPGTVRITSPNGGDTWQRGGTYEITWTSQAIGSEVWIGLWKGNDPPLDGWGGILTDNDGSYTLELPEDQPTGRNYRVKIAAASDLSIEDFSDSAFVIQAAPASGTIIVNSPDGGEIWSSGTTQSITWSSSGNPGSHVSIELYKNGNCDSTIESSTPNDGSYSWDVPTGQTTGSDYTIRITSTTNTSYSDDSESSFLIAAPPLPATSYLRASDGLHGDYVHLTWSSVDDADGYHIYRSENPQLTSAARVDASIIPSISDINGVVHSWQAPDYYASVGVVNYYWVCAYRDEFGTKVEGALAGPEPGHLLAPDVHEPDDTAETATEIATNGTAQLHTLAASIDVDWLVFDIAEGSEARVVITVDLLKAWPGLRLELFGPNESSSLLDQTDPWDASFDPIQGTIVRQSNNALVPGRYYLRAGSRPNVYYSPGEYSISVVATYVPTDISLSNDSTPENQPSGTTVGVFSTTDPDEGDTHTYTLVDGFGGTDNGAFTIVVNTLTTNTVFDYETKNSYSIRVRSTDQGGSSTEKVFGIQVTNSNDGPVAINDVYSVSEDATFRGSTVLGNDSDLHGGAPGENNAPLTVRLDQDVAHGTLVLSSDGAFIYEPDDDFNGEDSFTYQAVDSLGGTSNTVTVSIRVNPVNDAPSFAKGADQAENEDVGLKNVAGWATNISPGPADESGQGIHFLVTNDNEDLFTAAGQPAISEFGTLTYTPAPNGNGIAVVTVVLKDDGGTANGGEDTSAAQTFSIAVSSVNDVPSFTGGQDVVVGVDAGVQNLPHWATSISPGPANEADQSLTFLVGNSNPGLFDVGPAISNDGTLTFTPASDAAGSATVTAVLKDDGGIANGGVDTSDGQTFLITIGHEVDLDAKGKWQGWDANNEWLTISLTGPGTGTLLFPEDGNCDPIRLTLQDTTDKSSLKISTKGRGSDTTIGDIVIESGLLRRLTAKTTDIVGDGISATGNGYIGSVYVRDIRNGADIVLPGTGATRGITIKAGVLYSDTDIVLGSPLKSLTAVQWVGSSLTAPWASSISIKGDRRNDIAGDFGADLTFTGADPKKGIALGKLSVAGTITDSVITANFGSLGTITAAQWDSGSLDALWAKNIMTKGNRRDPSITGDFGAALNLTGQDSRGMSLNKLQVAGKIVGPEFNPLDPSYQINLAGGVGTIMAAQWDSGSLEALWAKNIMTKGNRRDPSITGDFGATLNLTGQDKRGMSLNKLQVAGKILDSQITLSGAAGTIMAAQWDSGSLDALWAKNIMTRGNRHDSAITGDFGATVNLTGQDKRGMSLNKLQVAGKILDSQITLSGAAGTIMAAQWDTGSLNATSVKSIVTKGNRREPTITGNFGADVTLTENWEYRRLALGTMKIAGWLVDSTIRTRGSIGKVTVGGIKGVSIYAGVKDDMTGLPLGFEDYDALARIRSLVVKGSMSEEGHSTIDSNVAACFLANVSIVEPNTQNGGLAFGFAAEYVTRFTKKDNGIVDVFKNLDHPNESLAFGDLKVSLCDQ